MRACSWHALAHGYLLARGYVLVYRYVPAHVYVLAHGYALEVMRLHMVSDFVVSKRIENIGGIYVSSGLCV